MIRCENCGEDYSITYKRCPFCDERPGRTGISGRRVADGGGYGGPVHPVQVVGLVISLILIIAALFIVFRYVGPLLFGNKTPGGSSVSTSQSGSPNGSQSSPGGSTSGSQLDPGASSGGDVSQPEPPTVSVTAIQLNRTDFTLSAGEVFQLTATLSPAGVADAVVWTSADPSVATVDEYGNVTNVNKGTALAKTTITAACGGKTAECIVYSKPSGSSSGGSTGGSTGGATGGSTTGSTGTVAPNTPGTIVNAGSGLNIRSGPGSSYEKVASASNGASITILEDSGTGWYKIDYGGGKTGYVSSDYVSVGG